MPDFRKRVEKRAAKLGLSPGERVLAACLTDPKGGAAKRAKATTGVGLAAGDLDQDTTGTEGLPAPMAERLPTRPLIIALTDQRLLAAKRSAALQQPTEVVCSWPLGEIVGLGVSKAGLLYHLTLIFSDRSAVQVEAVMASHPDRMSEAWDRLTGQS